MSNKPKTRKEWDEQNWDDYAEERAVFPKIGEHDIFLRKNKPQEDSQFQGKVLLMAVGRTLSLFPKQLKLIAREFRDTKTDKVEVDWIQDSEHERHVIPIIKDKI